MVEWLAGRFNLGIGFGSGSGSGSGFTEQSYHLHIVVQHPACRWCRMINGPIEGLCPNTNTNTD